MPKNDKPAAPWGGYDMGLLLRATIAALLVAACVAASGRRADSASLPEAGARPQAEAPSR